MIKDLTKSSVSKSANKNYTNKQLTMFLNQHGDLVSEASKKYSELIIKRK
jgi:hypothetical protein